MSLLPRKHKPVIESLAGRFSFCESVHAGPQAPHHIRTLTEIGLKMGGGADTETLCERGLSGGWDVRLVQADDDVALMAQTRINGSLIVCPTCAEVYARRVAEQEK